MTCHVLCPECGEGLGEVCEFIQVARQGYYKSLGNKIPPKLKSDKLEIAPDITKDIGFILDAAGLKLICCRMHILGMTNFDTIYK